MNISAFEWILLALALVNLIAVLSLRRRGKSAERDREPTGYAVAPQAAVPGADPRLVAVITAAVAAVLDQAPATSGSQGGFMVKNIRRVQNAPAWNRAGREEQIFSRM